MSTRREFLLQTGAAGVVAAASGQAAPGVQKASAAGSAAANTDLQATLKEILARHKVPGASVAVFDKGRLKTAAAGVINMSTGVELTPDTAMHIGSITKVFNATLVMQLVDEGKVDLDEHVVRYLPDLRLKDGEVLQQITVKMLLNHTSGIDGEMLPDQGHDEETIEKGIARFAQLGQVHRPGMEFSYNNAATVVAGYLVQRLRGRSWYELVRQRIFEPLKLEHAAALPEEALLLRASVGHFSGAKPEQIPVRTPRAFLPMSFSPAGTSLMMSARDLVTFARAHLAQGASVNGTRILSERSARTMREITVDNRGKGYTTIDGMGVGWMVSGNGLLSHGGGGPGVVAQLYAHPERQFALAVLTNAAYGWRAINDVIEPWRKEFAIERGMTFTQFRIAAEPAKKDIGRYVGVYENVTYRYRISPMGDGLAFSQQPKFVRPGLTAEATAPARLRPLGGDRFVLEPNPEDGNPVDQARTFTFRNSGADGRMEHLGTSSRLYRRVS